MPEHGPRWGAVDATFRVAAMAARGRGAGLHRPYEHGRRGRYAPVRAATTASESMGETCPQYLFFTQDHLRRPDGSKWICSPPHAQRRGQRPPVGRLAGWNDCRPSALIIVRSSLMARRPITYEGQAGEDSGQGTGPRTTSQRSRTDCRECRIDFRSCGRMASVPAGLRPISSWLSTAPTRRGSSVCIRGKVRCCPARMQIS